jgi:lysophospholipase L1-like esterase
LEAVDAVNRGYEDLSRKKDGVFYVDVNPALQNLAGESRGELYVEDGLHLNVKGNHQMTTLLKPAIKKFWKNETKL